MAPQGDLTVSRRLTQLTQTVLSPRRQRLACFGIVGCYGSVERAAFVTGAVHTLHNLDLLRDDTLRFDLVGLLRSQSLMMRHAIDDIDSGPVRLDRS
ncbi:MAG: hypothetical protein EOO81_01045 [Oxalobacteraceae bacterium]|nr:MAG: hypothetical protein EOO81_01045 [Oxalobacteraceae bacterium]